VVLLQLNVTKLKLEILVWNAPTNITLIYELLFSLTFNSLHIPVLMQKFLKSMTKYANPRYRTIL